MVIDRNANYSATKQDFVHITILLTIALVIGLYLIVTSVLVAQDGIFYIERAQKLSSEPVRIIKQHPPGYPFMIFMAHKFVTLFSDSSSAYTWIYSAQGVTLLCKILSLIPLYFIGKLLVGDRRSFWAIIILIMLPHPAEFGSDVLREWPHLLFLAMGFLFLLLGAKEGKLWMFGMVGLCAGLGHMIRPECAQLIVYGVLWLLINLWRPKHNTNRTKLIYALLILLITFAVLTVPYIKIRDRILPAQLERLISSTEEVQTGTIQEQGYNNSDNLYMSSSGPVYIARAGSELVKELAEILMYFFLLAMLVGIYQRFHKLSTSTDIERFFVPTFVLFNVIMLFLLYHNYEYISTRYCLPLIAFLCFYIPSGLQLIGNRLANGFSNLQVKTNKRPQIWFFILLAIGLAICLPKLVRPMRIEKKGYRVAAEWLRENTAQEDIIAVRDSRISFYAERKRVGYDVSDHNRIIFHEERHSKTVTTEAIPAYVKYIVRKTKNKDEILDYDRGVQEMFSSWNNDNQMKYRTIIYKVL